MPAALVALGIAIPDRRSANNSAKYHSSASSSANATYLLAWKAGRAAERGALASATMQKLGLGSRSGECGMFKVRRLRKLPRLAVSRQVGRAA
jgi:hypothetical protein